MRKEIEARDLWNKLNILFDYPSDVLLRGHEDNISRVLLQLFKALGYDDSDIKEKPQIIHAITGKNRREPDYGIYKYEKKQERYGMVVDKKSYGLPITDEMEEKTAGYCVLAGALYGIITNGEIIIVIKPTRGAVQWDYEGSIPSREQLESELKESTFKYKAHDIVYSRRITAELDERVIEDIAEKCHNIIRSRKGTAVPERLYEFSKLLVARILDEREYKTGLRSDLLITKENIDSLKEKQASIKEYITTILEKVRGEIGIFREKEGVDLEDDIIEQIVDYLDDYQLWSEKMDILGHVYEKFLMNTMTGRELGGYFTPRSVVDFIVRMIDIEINKSILDPACGSGGFLISSLIYLKEKHNIRKPEEIRRIANKFQGIDLFSEIVKLSQINLWLHGDCHDNIHRADSLELTERTPAFIKEALIDPENNGLDYVLTNPPYGAEVGNKIPADRFSRMGRQWKDAKINLYESAIGLSGSRQIGVQPQVPFIELCIKLLKKPKSSYERGGILGIVIDNGIMSNTVEEAPVIRNLIQKYCNVKAIIGLPKGTFKAYGSNVIPVIIIAERKHESQKQGFIFRAEACSIGLVPGRTKYIKDSSDDLDKILGLWDSFQSMKKDGDWILLDSTLPAWSTKGFDTRMDNNFWSPSYFRAKEMIEALSGDYTIKKLGDITDFIDSGVAPSKDGEIPLLEGINIQPNFIFPVISKYTELVEDKKRLLLKKGDLLMVKDGSPSTVAIVTDAILSEFGEVVPSYHLYLIRLNNEYVKYAYFVAVFLNSRLGQSIVRRYISGSVSPTIRDGDVDNIEVIIPKKEAIEEYSRRIEELQQNAILSRAFMSISEELDKSVGVNNIPKLPINWLPGGKKDKQGYWKNI